MDLNEIAALVGLASTTTGTVRDVTGIASQIRTALAGEKIDRDEVIALVHQMHDRAMAARELQAKLSDALHDLQKMAKQEADFDEVLNRYEMIRLPGGGFVWHCFGPVDREIPHFICPNCADDRKRSFLQGSDDAFDLRCPRCRATFPQHEPFVGAVDPADDDGPLGASGY